MAHRLESGRIDTTVLNGIDLEIAHGEQIVVIGPLRTLDFVRAPMQTRESRTIARRSMFGVRISGFP